MIQQNQTPAVPHNIITLILLCIGPTPSSRNIENKHHPWSTPHISYSERNAEQLIVSTVDFF